MFNKIVLIGPPGAGKSSIGKALAKELSLPFIDSDGEIEKSVGKKISEIFVDDGEPHFRVLEMEKVKQLLEDFVGVISNRYEGGLNTGALLKAMRNRALEKGVQIFNGVEVLSYIEKDSAVELETSVGIWNSKQVAFCTSSFHAHLFQEEKMLTKRNQFKVETCEIISSSMTVKLSSSHSAAMLLTGTWVFA